MNNMKWLQPGPGIERSDRIDCLIIDVIDIDLFDYLFAVTLHDIVHTEKSLTLVFEYLEKDLKQYMDDCGNILSMNNVKVSRKKKIINSSNSFRNDVIRFHWNDIYIPNSTSFINSIKKMKFDVLNQSAV